MAGVLPYERQLMNAFRTAYSRQETFINCTCCISDSWYLIGTYQTQAMDQTAFHRGLQT